VALCHFELVIFDCDGVLVDSERLVVRTEAEILCGLGWSISEAEIIERFVGRSAAYMHHEIERNLGRSVDWDTEFDARYREIFERELLPVPGIEDALDQITTTTCVASSGSHEKMRFTLGITGLLARFEERIFSVDEVEHGKPEPDIFFVCR
jgi:beta-phosphoglucomutase-like phosphatase (HAD superfamily)